MRSEIFQKSYSHIPHQPGVYKYYNARDEILYVGKAKDLKKRIGSYFQKNHPYPKTRLLVGQIARIEFIIVDTEHDAFLLENNLIKKYQPKYNINLKDDKTFPYLVIKKEPFPRVFFSRKISKDGSEYIGPFTSIFIARALLKYITENFKLRTCTLHLSDTNIQQKKYKPCLKYHLGNCKAPCAGLQNAESYANDIQNIRQILKGNTKAILQTLRQEMLAAAAEWNFEKAQRKKNQIAFLKQYNFKTEVESVSLFDADVFAFDKDEDTGYIHALLIRNGKITHTHISPFTIVADENPADLLSIAIQQYREKYNSTAPEIIVPFRPACTDKNILITIPMKGDKKKFLTLAEKNLRYYKEALTKRNFLNTATPLHQEKILYTLQKDLYLNTLPVHIECFDNSNLQGSFPVSAMVCFKNGLPSKKDYRVFKIKTVSGIDDFATMKEVVYRRYKRVVDENLPLPNLIIIDGGKGQLNASKDALERLGLKDSITLIGLAKNKEEIFFITDKESKILPLDSPSLQLIQNIRNEVHRFVIAFHRKQRSKGTIRTELSNIKGIGKKISEKLLLNFHSTEKLKNTEMSEIAKVIGKKKAILVKTHFDKNSLSKKN